MKITHGSILAIFFLASQAEVEEGRQWYINARLFCDRLSTDYHLSREIVAGVVAALSPNNRWERNLIDAEALCKVWACDGDLDSVRVSTFGSNKQKAIEILKGAAPLDVLGGLKVRAFYGCIIGSDDSVCVDGHAYSIWIGNRVPTTQTPKISPKLYETIANDYKLAARQISGITGRQFSAAEVQAVTWVAWRNLVKAGGDE